MIKFRFVEFIPDELENGVLYISGEYSVAVHMCFCGCNNEVVTPLSPTGWQLFYDGKRVSLYPSIGNWSLPCRSHYWITNNKVVWVRRQFSKAINKNWKNHAIERQEILRPFRKWKLLDTFKKRS